MEKFAVDLEKVLDDFEYSEEQQNEYSNDQHLINNSFNCNFKIYPHHYRTPASNYRRPPFEPVNLADADFSVSPRPPSKQISSNHSIPISVSNTISADYESSTEIDNSLIGSFDTPLLQALHKVNEDISEYSHFPAVRNKTEFKPDLIESNTDVNFNLNELGRIERNLPDIASTDVEIKEERKHFSSTSELLLYDTSKDPNSFSGINDSSQCETSKDQNQRLVQFKIDNNSSDEELKQYLEQLEFENTAECNSAVCENSNCNISQSLSNSLNENNCSKIDTKDFDSNNHDKELHNSDIVMVPYKNKTDTSNIDNEVDNKIIIKVGSVEAPIKSTLHNEELTSDLRNVQFNELNYTLVCKENEEEESINQLENVPSVNMLMFVSDNHSQSSMMNASKNITNSVLSQNVLDSVSDNVIEEIKCDSNTQVNESTVECNDTNKNICDVEENSEELIDCKSLENQLNEFKIESSKISDVSNSCESTFVGNKNNCTDEVNFDDPVSKAKEVNNLNSYSENKSSELDNIENNIAVDKIDSNAIFVNSESSNNIASNLNNLNTIINKSITLSENESCVNTRAIVSDQCNDSQTENNFGSIGELNFQSLDSKTAISNLEFSIDSVSKLNIENNNQDEISVDDSTDGFINEDENSISSDKMLDEQPKLQRPSSLNLAHISQTAEMSSTSADSGSLLSTDECKLGKEAPFWMPDSETTVCLQCQMKFTLVRRRHHCRACGLVLCGKCCDMKANLEYLKFEEARICRNCHSILERTNTAEKLQSVVATSSTKKSNPNPNPNNPMEYCSRIPPPLQVDQSQQTRPTVLVPVLKREGRSKTNDVPKQVMFSDGIRPGGDLTEFDALPEPRLPLRKPSRITKRVGTPPGSTAIQRRHINPETRSFIPSNNDLPPLVTKQQGEYVFSELEKPLNVDDEAVKFAINRNLFVIVKRIMLDCCVNRDVWCMTTEGLACVGQDEIVFILEVLTDETYPPKDVFITVNLLFQEASKGSIVTEMSFASPCLNQMFGSKDYGGFVFIRPTYQCVQKLVLPRPPFLIALLIHRWEAPWARLFPIRLVLRLGAEFRYYPCPLVSIRNRPTVFTEIGHTIISLLADFRKYSYSLPTVRGLVIHMEDRLTSILLPRNRYDQVLRALNNSEANVLAFAGNISTIADSHLVCMQSTQDDTSYHTQAINIHNKPRQVTGASFIVFNGSLKQCGWSGKSNIVEDGLMVLIPSESMVALRNALRHMKDYSIGCGPQAEEMVVLKWSSDDTNFNIGVKSSIDNKPLDGVPSIRVHNGTDYSGSLRIIRWTEVFIIQSDEETGNKTGETVNISKLSESIARATCIALVPLLDLLATANLTTLAVRATIHPESVGYEAGSKGEKLPPLYMKSLDEQLIAVVHEAAVNVKDVSCPVILELIFKIMEQG